MHRSSNQASSRHIAEPFPKALAIRTYLQIAQALAERDGTATTEALVGQMCRAAERKIASALLADPVVRERFLPGDGGAPTPRNPRRMDPATAREAGMFPGGTREYPDQGCAGLWCASPA